MSVSPSIHAIGAHPWQRHSPVSSAPAVAAGIAVMAALAAAAACEDATAQPVPSTTPAPPPTTTRPSPQPEPAQQAQLLEAGKRQEIREAVLTLPEWPGGHDKCRSGEFDFDAEGEALIEQGDSYGNTWVYVLTHPETDAIVANVDGVEGDEYLVTVGRGGPELHFALLALAPDGDGFRALGYVMAATGIVDGPDRF